jgi:hypothetical protein
MGEKILENEKDNLILSLKANIQEKEKILTLCLSEYLSRLKIVEAEIGGMKKALEESKKLSA